jgi:glyoxalase family protein
MADPIASGKAPKPASLKKELAAKLQTQGVHHITLMGADRQTSIDFWEGLLGMPLVFEQPNLDAPDQNHLYFDPGDGRLITIFTSENWRADPTPNPNAPGNLHHLAFTVSLATYRQAVTRLKARRIASSGEVDRGFMHSIYFREPLGQLIELACYKFEPPAGFTHADVLRTAHEIRLERGAYNIAEEHLADAIEALVQRSR